MFLQEVNNKTTLINEYCAQLNGQWTSFKLYTKPNIRRTNGEDVWLNGVERRQMIIVAKAVTLDNRLQSFGWPLHGFDELSLFRFTYINVAGIHPSQVDAMRQEIIRLKQRAMNLRTIIEE